MYQLQDYDRIFVFTGPYGAGRKTIADMVGETLGLQRVIPYTTRPRRSAEVDGQDYHFISESEFCRMHENNEFIETLNLDGVQHGIRERDIEQYLQQNGSIYLILNHRGAELLKNVYGSNLIRICIHTDEDTIRTRQRKRGYAEDVIARHLLDYPKAMAYRENCEHSFANTVPSHTAFAVAETLEQYLNRNLVPDIQ
ncbi:guanylate kinase [Aneurinibacillus soli]|uniref:Guanylate kinase n=1 Tax=Aneurinibacillus soli TaxID=1500254 RepID=A0A0U5BCB0_9BACL|nr:hypothetical protein [Aneurinibacillus soli]PYE61777.1 guanylate kinase [Aneurinibacillus soli]BAU28365.1 Guanylate kinase [Aneurinibacillus soli]